MRIHNPILRWFLAISIASLAGVGFVVVFGMVAPMFIQYAVYGVETVSKAPANGSAILLLTVPFSAVVALFGVIVLAIVLGAKPVVSSSNNSLQRQ